MSSPLNDVPIEDRLREVFEKTDSREYAEALDALEMARSTDPENIYISALRRQLDALLSLSQADGLGEDQRHDLMEPMPGIIDCAIRDSHRQRRTIATGLPPHRQKKKRRTQRRIRTRPKPPRSRARIPATCKKNLRR